MGLDFIESIGIDRISARIKSLIHYLAQELKSLHHSNGKPQVKIFGPDNFENRGGNIILNIFDVHDKAYPFEQIENLTNNQGISIRSGCFCNPGIDEINNCITTEEISKYFLTRDNGNYHDMITYLGKMRGATRVSVGMATTKADLDTFIQLVGQLKDQEAA
jgi:selenocysteine lyase/cysteine desulfurase